ncbi:MAG: SpoIIE family protein phosphatase [Bacteroidales bacterium]|nr:SpoIIE family protein phosphatase [Bacteroidales bacterium]
MKNILLYILLLFSTTIYAQDVDIEIHEIDSLRNIVKYSHSDSIKAHCYFQICNQSSTTDTVIKYSLLALDYYKKQTNDTINIKLYNYLGWGYYYNDEYKKAYNSYKKALEISKKNNLIQSNLSISLKMANCLSYIQDTVQNEKWLIYYSIYESAVQNNDTYNIIFSNRMLGEEFIQLELYKSAYYHFYFNEQICKEIKDTLNLAYTYIDIAYSLVAQYYDYSEKKIATKKLRIAEYYLDKATNYLKNKSSNDFILQTFICRSIDIYKDINTEYYKIYKDPKYLNKAQEYSYKNIAWNEHVGDDNQLLNTYINNANIYFLKKEYKKGKNELDKIAQEKTSFIENKEKYYKLLHEYYIHIKDYKNASSIMDTLMKEKESQKMITSIIEELKNESEIKLKVMQQSKDQELEHNKTKFKTENEYNTKLNILLTLGILILLGLTIIIIILYILRQRAAKEVSKRKEELEQKGKQIHSSIVYAERIQKAALQPVGYVKKIFNDSFVYYNPKDIVSGDFYMVSQNENYKLMIVADCTGHGVPGGFLSMLGISALKEIITLYSDFNPGKILNSMRTFVKTTLNNGQKVDNNNQQLMMADGMDMIVCSYDEKNKKLYFAAANLCVYICRNGIMTRYKGDSMPVGCYIIEKENFTTKQIDIEKGDMIYLPTDGFQEQIGGEEQRRYSIIKMQNFFASIYDKDVDIQNKMIGDEIEQWTKHYYQLDDMTIVGIRL